MRRPFAKFPAPTKLKLSAILRGKPQQHGQGGKVPPPLLVPVVTAIVTAFLMLPIQYLVVPYQVQAELNSWREKEYFKKFVEDQQRRRRLVAEFRQLHEEFMTADMMFTISSEMYYFRESLDRYTRLVRPDAMASVNEVFSRISTELGLSRRENVFSSSAKEYAEKRAKLVGMLAEIDFYFSDDVVGKIRVYYKVISSADESAPDTMKFWNGTSKTIIDEYTKGTATDEVIISAVMNRIRSVRDRAQTNVDLYNIVYQAMREEILAREPKAM